MFATVTLPLAAPGLVAGLILGFAKAIGEFGATITFVANIPGETQTIATAIFVATQDPNGEAADLAPDRDRHNRRNDGDRRFRSAGAALRQQEARIVIEIACVSGGSERSR